MRWATASYPGAAVATIRRSTMVAMAKVRRLRGKLNILGARFYDGFGKFARLLLVLGGTASFADSGAPRSGGWRERQPEFSPVGMRFAEQKREEHLQRRTKRILATSLFAILWIATVAFGLQTLFQYENTPGRVGALPRAWPASQIERSSDRPTLIMLAHPHCPCTRASVGELAQIMARLQGKVAAYVLLVKPKEAGRDWEETDLVRSAEAIPGRKGPPRSRWRGSAPLRRGDIRPHAACLERMDGCFLAGGSRHPADTPGTMPGRARFSLS